jgi:hypothetical protein
MQDVCGQQEREGQQMLGRVHSVTVQGQRREAGGQAGGLRCPKGRLPQAGAGCSRRTWAGAEVEEVKALPAVGSRPRKLDEYAAGGGAGLQVARVLPCSSAGAGSGGGGGTAALGRRSATATQAGRQAGGRAGRQAGKQRDM